ncbi:hypothetical protein LZ198_28460 [Myxococcus sp. K15C18031901]|uniref:hypothetical protein n=1 Tax=Myxococcus dinghuensis TaxID=2906761 RepID=UPI0020A7BEE9|nr:hypothetical protein [Myxococcus dinghuensis]MCP3102816.1 hypothetical protein [Myxococcus dinghuensis]
MKQLFVAVLLAWGVVGCGAGAVEESASLESTEQEICPAECPPGTQFGQYIWLCTGETSSACASGYEQEYAACYDPASGSYVTGTTTCRRRCGCAISES